MTSATTPLFCNGLRDITCFGVTRMRHREIAHKRATFADVSLRPCLKQEVSVLSTFDQKKDVVKQEYAGLTSAGGMVGKNQLMLPLLHNKDLFYFVSGNLHYIHHQ